jgi:hypothetical protein
MVFDGWALLHEHVRLTFGGIAGGVLRARLSGCGAAHQSAIMDPATTQRLLMATSRRSFF